MKVKEVITVRGWIEGSGWSYSTVYDTNEINVEKSDLKKSNIDWSWFDADGARDGEDTEITVSWYPIDGDEDTKPIVEWSTWASELVEVKFMKNKQIYQYFGEATNYDDPDAFASDVALSLMDPEDPSKEIDIELYEQLRTLWRVANAPFQELIKEMGLNQTQCSIRFCIPLRTIQDWAGDRRTPPAYLRLMMAESIGLLQLRDDASPIR